MERSEKTSEINQAFLSSAISDISTYIQLSDTKVSIIMGALVALIAGFLACCDPISQAFSKIKPCSWQGIVITVFIFGILTIRGHVSKINYKSKWFLSQNTKEYSFDTYKKDLVSMTDKDIIENMAAELYKLNDINRQKAFTAKWAIHFFAAALGTGAIVGMLLFISVM